MTPIRASSAPRARSSHVATRLENGDVAVSPDSSGQKVVGFVGAYNLSNAPVK